MQNTFLFIIPLTPASHLSESRLFLRQLCFENLRSQTYSGWKALLIGKLGDHEAPGSNFIQVDFEGHKEEKLQMATQYIQEQQVEADYIIRLDDDDIFNPQLLKKLSGLSFDLYVDKCHYYWNSETGCVSRAVRYWFPNTCIHKRSHALSAFGNFPPGNYTRYKSQCLLIENEHNDFHHYYSQDHRILFSEKNAPVYLRTINPGSITSQQATRQEDYMNSFGFWKKNTLKDFLFLNRLKMNKKPGGQTWRFLIGDLKSTLISLKNYNRIVIRKDGV